MDQLTVPAGTIIHIGSYSFTLAADASVLGCADRLKKACKPRPSVSECKHADTVMYHPLALRYPVKACLDCGLRTEGPHDQGSPAEASLRDQQRATEPHAG